MTDTIEAAAPTQGKGLTAMLLPELKQLGASLGLKGTGAMRKGQLIGEADGWISAAVHAPTSGAVAEVAMHVQPHPSGLDALCVVIEPDGRDEWIERWRSIME